MANELTKVPEFMIDSPLSPDVLDKTAITDVIEKELHLNNKISKLQEINNSQSRKQIETDLELSYLSRRTYYPSDIYIENFFNTKQTENYDNDESKIVDIMCDTEFNNNWKVHDHIGFKNGFIRNQTQPYMLQVLDQYNLEGIGQNQKCGISRYDTINNCYWMMTNAGASNEIGQILKISKDTKNKKITVLASWYLEAGGTNNSWTGIDVDIDNQVLFVVLRGDGTSGGMAAIKINSDETLGLNNTKNGGRIDHSTTPDGTNTYDYSAWWFGDVNYFSEDVTVWDDNNIAIIASDNVTSPQPIKIIMVGREFSGGSFNTNTINDITGIEKYLIGQDTTGQGLIREGNTLWVVTNDSLPFRYIFKININTDIANNQLIKHSGRFSSTLKLVASTGVGLSITPAGNLLEIVSTSSSGQYISERAVGNAIWAENQVCSEYVCNASENPNNPLSIMIENNQYYWTADVQVADNQVDVYRFNIVDGSYKHVRFISGGWNYLFDFTTDGSTIWICGFDGTYYEVFFGDLSSLISSMGDSYNIANTLDLTSWGSRASGIGSANLDVVTNICYDYDNDLVYILNRTTNTIDLLSKDGVTWTKNVFNLQTPVYNYWTGIAYKNNNLYVIDHNNVIDELSRIVEIDTILSDNTSVYISHIYQDAIIDIDADKALAIDFDGDNLVGIHRTMGKFSSIKTLHDPDVMQVQSFINEKNILLSNGVSCSTPIIERFFAPEDFTDIRNIPDKNYCAIGYDGVTVAGFSVLHLDDFLGGRSSSGQPRYDVRKIRVHNANTGLTASIPYKTESIIIERDMIFWCASRYDGDSTYPSLKCVDLKNGLTFQVAYLVVSGQQYNGSYSERNDGSGWSGATNEELELSILSSDSDHINKLQAYTFTKEDQSDYIGEYPKTFVAIGTDNGCDLLVIDWNQNNDRTPVKVWNNIFETTSFGRRALFIAPSGKIFAGAFNSNGALLQHNKLVWDIAEDSSADYTEIGADILLSNIMDISPNSRCWKISSGEWRHQLLCGTWDSTTAPGVNYGLVLVDVENEDAEWIFMKDTGTIDEDDAVGEVDMFEDKIFGVWNQSISGTERWVGILNFKKNKFDDKINSDYVRNNWTPLIKPITETRGVIMDVDRPFFVFGYNISSIGRICKYSKDHNILSVGNDARGIQLLYFQNMDECIHKSIEISCDNPEFIHNIQNSITPDGEKCDSFLKTNSNVTYIDGDSSVWENLGTVQNVQLEDASNINRTEATFGNPAVSLKKDDGSNLLEGIDYKYESRLDQTGGDDVDIYDDNIDGAFDSGKYFRVIENGKNASDASGLNLAVYAKDLNMMFSPPKDQIWIDPLRGKFVLPRPTYWSRCESVANTLSPEIESSNPPENFSNWDATHVVATSAKFGSGVAVYNPTNLYNLCVFLPLGASPVFDKMVISSWVKVAPVNDMVFRYIFGLDWASYVGLMYSGGGWSHHLYVNGSLVSSDASSVSSFSHFYVVLSKNADLTGGKSIRIFLNGIEIMSSTTAFTPNINFLVHMLANNNSYPDTVSLDNLKIWDHIVSEDPSWEYNGGAGREDALHEIYGSANGYKPVLDSSSTPDSGVGYYYLPSVFAPAKLNYDSSIEGYMTWSNISNTSRIGINFVKGVDGGRAIVNLLNQSEKKINIGNTVINQPYITGMNDTSELSIGMSVEGDNIPNMSRIITIVDNDEIIIDKNAMDTATGTALSFYPCVLENKIIDLYDQENGDQSDLEYVFWISVDKNIEYKVNVEHNGDWSTGSVADHSIRLRQFLLTSIFPSVADSKIVLYHTDWKDIIRKYTLLPGETIETYADAVFSGDGVETVFILYDINRASYPVKISEDGGNTWIYPSSYLLSWGSNAPDYDNEIVENGYFGVKFDNAPVVGNNNVIIKFIPAVNACYMETTLKQPSEDNNIDRTKNVRLLDFGIEIVE